MVVAPAFGVVEPAAFVVEGVGVIFGFGVAPADGVVAPGVPTRSSVLTFPAGGVSSVPGIGGGGFGENRIPSDGAGGTAPPRFVLSPLSAGPDGAGECWA